MPQALIARLPEFLREQAEAAEGHWLDVLLNALNNHRDQFTADVEALAAEACPPLIVFQHGRNWLRVGSEFRKVYSDVFRHAAAGSKDGELLDAAVFERAAEASEGFLAGWPAERRHDVLLGAMAYLYAEGGRKGEAVRDAVLWQLGKRDEDGQGRLPGIAQLTIAALREIGALDETGTVVERAGVPVQLNGVWFNLQRVLKPGTPDKMSLMPKPIREEAKKRVADYVTERFIGMTLYTAVTDDDRVITRTEHGNLFGFVQPDHELYALRHDQWKIAWATAVDGNVRAILQPVS
jgi:hypothetical protein